MTSAMLMEPSAPPRALMAHDGVPEFDDDFYEVVDCHRVENRPMGAREAWIANFLKRHVDLQDPELRFGTSHVEVRFILRDSPRLERQPDFSFVSFDRWPLKRSIGAGASWNVVPDWVVEVISPSNYPTEFIDRVHEYFAAGVRLVWVLFPSVREVYVYTTPSSIRVVGMDEILDGGPVLPDFRLPMQSLFVLEESVVGPEVNGHKGHQGA